MNIYERTEKRLGRERERKRKKGIAEEKERAVLKQCYGFEIIYFRLGSTFSALILAPAPFPALWALKMFFNITVVTQVFRR